MNEETWQEAAIRVAEKKSSIIILQRSARYCESNSIHVISFRLSMCPSGVDAV